MKMIVGSLGNLQTDSKALVSKISFSASPPPFLGPSITPTSTVDIENLVFLFENRVNLGLSGDQKGVKLGGLAFGSPADLEAW